MTTVILREKPISSKARSPRKLPLALAIYEPPSVENDQEPTGMLLSTKFGMNASAKPGIFRGTRYPPEHLAFKNRRRHPHRRRARLAKERLRLTLLA